MIRLFVLNVLTFFFSVSYGQINGFLGKKMIVKGGTSLNVPSINWAFGNNHKVQDFYTHSMFPPKIELESGINLTKDRLISLRIGKQWLQNTGFKQTFDIDRVRKLDEFDFKTDAFSFGVELYFFKEFSPIGRYTALGFGYSKMTTHIYPTFTEEVYSNNGIASRRIRKDDPGIHNTNAYSISLAVGRHRLIKRNVFLDYGYRITLYWDTFMGIKRFISGSKFTDSYMETEFNYKKEFESIVEYINKRNIRSTNLFEIYLKIGFTK